MQHCTLTTASDGLKGKCKDVIKMIHYFSILWAQYCTSAERKNSVGNRKAENRRPASIRNTNSHLFQKHSLRYCIGPPHSSQRSLLNSKLRHSWYSQSPIKKQTAHRGNLLLTTLTFVHINELYTGSALSS